MTSWRAQFRVIATWQRKTASFKNIVTTTNQCNIVSDFIIPEIKSWIARLETNPLQFKQPNAILFGLSWDRYASSQPKSRNLNPLPKYNFTTSFCEKISKYHFIF